MENAEGQVSTGTETTGDGTQTTGAAPNGETSGQQTTSQTGTVQAEESFFDPESIKDKPELMSAYKEMQKAFTTKTTSLKSQMQKVQAYDAFMSNPAQAIQELASQYGFQLTRAQAQQIANEQQQQNSFEPKSWEEVMSAAEQRAEQRIMQKLSPFLNQVKDTRKSQLEQTLDDNCPDWRVYEDKMKDMLGSHPTLANDPVTLYRLSVPPEVLESRAAQAAIRKLQNKASSAQVSGGSTTNQQAPEVPKGKMSFNQAVEHARATLAAQGLKPAH